MDERLPSLEQWMTADEVATWLGVSTRVLSSNRIPHARVGERRFYNKHDVARWLEQRRDKVNPE
jgi:excisionase family DNA binding protein